MSINLLLVTRETPADLGFGIGAVNLRLQQALRSRGHQVRYLYQQDLGPRARRLQERFHRWLGCRAPDAVAQRWMILAWILLERLNMGRLAAKVARTQSVDCVHCHDPFIGLGYYLFSGLGRGPRWGITEHGFGSYAQSIHEEGVVLGLAGLRGLRRLEAWILRRASWVLCPTRAAQGQLQRDLAQYPLPDHWIVIPHPRPEPGSWTREQARQWLGWHPEDCYVVTVGRRSPIKGHELILQACASWLRAQPGRHLVFLGFVPDPAWLALLGSLGLGAQVECRWAQDVRPWLRAADLYLSASLTESFGLANLEALAAGCPSICTAVGGVPEVTGGAALLVPPHEPHAMAKTLNWLTACPELLAAWRARASAHTEAWPDVTEIAARYEQLYQGRKS